MRALCLLLGAALLWPLAGAAAGADAPASAVVERLHAVLAANMASAGARGFEARRAALEPVVAEVFDFRAIARVALGRSWDAMDEALRERFQALMREESVLTYAARFASGAGARLVLDEEAPVRGGRRLVRARLLPEDGEPVSLDYVLHRAGDGWRIVNVLAQGVSDLSLKRAQFAVVIEDAGVGALARRLEEQVEALAREGASGS